MYLDNSFLGSEELRILDILFSLRRIFHIYTVRILFISMDEYLTFISDILGSLFIFKSLCWIIDVIVVAREFAVSCI